MPRVRYCADRLDSTRLSVGPSVGAYLISVGRSSCTKRLNQRQSMTPEGAARSLRPGPVRPVRRLSHPAAAAAAAAETGVRPFKRSVVIHSSYCSVLITAPAVVDVLLGTARRRVDGRVRRSFSPVIGNRFTEHVCACVRVVGGGYIATRASGQPACSTCRSRTICAARLARPPCLDIYCRFIAGRAERTSSSGLDRSALTHGQTVLAVAVAVAAASLRVLSPVYRALLPGERHTAPDALRVLWLAISRSNVERTLNSHRAVALGEVVGDSGVHRAARRGSVTVS